MPLAGAACVFGAGQARASPAVVMLAPRDRPKVTRSLREAVAAQLSDVKLELRVVPVASLPTGSDCRMASARDLAKSRDVAAVFWFDPRDNRVCLLLAPDRGGRLVNRRVGGAGEEGRYEAVAVLVRTAVRGSRPPRRPASGPETGPRGLLPARPLHRPGQAWLELELAYALDLIAPVAIPLAVPLAHGLRLAVQVRVHRSWSLFLGYRLEARVAVDDGNGAVEVQRYPVDAGVRFRWWYGALELGTRLGGGFAYTRLLQRQPSSSANAVKSTSEWLVFLGVYGYVGVRLTARLLLFGSVGARFFVLNARYQLDDDEVLLAPWTVQPSFLLGLSVDLF
jgi:hypothetical protein